MSMRPHYRSPTIKLYSNNRL